MLVDPCFEFSRSTGFVHGFQPASHSALAVWIDVSYLGELSKTLSRLLNGISVITGMAAPAMVNRNLSSTFSFLSTLDLDMAHLKLIRAHTNNLLQTLQKFTQHPGTDLVLTVRPTMSTLMCGRRSPELIRGFLHSGSAELVSIFMAKENNITEIVQPVIMLMST